MYLYRIFAQYDIFLTEGKDVSFEDFENAYGIFNKEFVCEEISRLSLSAPGMIPIDSTLYLTEKTILKDTRFFEVLVKVGMQDSYVSVKVKNIELVDYACDKEAMLFVEPAINVKRALALSNDKLSKRDLINKYTILYARKKNPLQIPFVEELSKED